ncbi:MAG: ATPase [Lentimicrobiaceae bacterium]|jgi:N-acetylglucosamine kinase-like BadF-type ATPase|nr:ATPase [Lentimicrobiaceae bacterium]
MFLLIDSGSTKTDYSFLKNGCVKRTFQTSGYNPYYHTPAQITTVLKTEFPNDLPFDDVTKIVYYGSGCSTETNCLVIADALQFFFKKAHIKVHHDLLAAAHALLGRSEGIACILGTGSNSCYYDGENILENVPSLGFMLGDEGSGATIGRELLKAYFYGEFPEDLAQKFSEMFPLTLDAILTEVYQGKKPSKFIASFAPFAKAHETHPTIKKLLAKVFDAFIDAQLSKYSRYQEVPVGFIGSIAYYFNDSLRERLSNANIQMGTVLPSPSKGLIRYYSE